MVSLAFITESPKGETMTKSSSFRDKRNKFDDGLLEEGVDLKRSLKAECLGICSSKNNTCWKWDLVLLCRHSKRNFLSTLTQEGDWGGGDEWLEIQKGVSQSSRTNHSLTTHGWIQGNISFQNMGIISIILMSLDFFSSCFDLKYRTPYRRHPHHLNFYWYLVLQRRV